MQGSLSPVVERAHRNFVEAYSWIARSMPEGEIQEADGAILVRSGLPSRAFNVVFAFHPVSRPERLTDRIRRLFADSQAPWRLIGTRASAPSLGSVLPRSGARPQEALQGMILDRIPETPSRTPPGFEVVRVKDLEELRTCFRIDEEVMGGPPDFWEPLLAARGAKLLEGEAGFYLGRLEGQPVATSRGFPSDGVTGVYLVRTIAAFRNRGIGAAMSWAAAGQGVGLGIRTSCLQSSEMGRSVYQGMGYRTVVEYPQWVHGDDEAPASR